MDPIGRRDFIKDLSMISVGTVFLSGLKVSAADLKQMDEMQIPGGFATSAGVSAQGWYAASLVLSDEQRHSFSDTIVDSHMSFEERTRAMKKWLTEQQTVCPAKLVLSTSWQIPEVKEIACEEIILFPVTPKEKTEFPVVVFISRDRGIWHLNLYREGALQKLFTSENSIRYPSVISLEKDVIVSFEQEKNNQGLISLINSKGKLLYQTDGRRAKLVKTGKSMALMKEVCDPNGIVTCVELIEKDRLKRSLYLPEVRDYVFNGNMGYHDGKLFVVAESTHAFGEDDRMGNFRELRAWCAALQDQKFEPVAEQSLIPVPEKTSTWNKENLSPIRPEIVFERDDPVVIFRQFRDDGFKKFGWDLYKTTLKRRKWSPPVRMTEHLVSPDTGFGWIQQGDSWLLAIPSFDNIPHAIKGEPVVPSRHRIQFIDQHMDTSFPEIIGNGSRKYNFEESTGYKHIAQKPPELSGKTADRFLIWGDMHVHSTYSKCIASMNGMPDEVFRYQRDVLQNEVLCSLEHSKFLKGSEQKYVFDLLEAESSGNHIVLFGDEPSIIQGRHTNFYTFKREVMEQLRNIVILFERDRTQIYKAIKALMQKDDLMVTRHFHGDFYPTEKEMLDSYDPELEWVFEAMQGRTNAMMEDHFPNQFLNGGKKVGLYGGTDHYRGVGPNHYCLTGFWVKDFSPEGVWEALKNRKTVAVSDAKIAMFATLNEHLFGEEIKVKQSEMIFSVDLSSVRPVKRAGLMRDGKMVEWLPVNSTTARIELKDTAVPRGYHWYSVTAEAESAYDDFALGHLSPFYVHVI